MTVTYCELQQCWSEREWVKQKSDLKNLIHQVYHQILLQACGQKHSCGKEATKEGLQPKVTPPAWGMGKPGGRCCSQKCVPLLCQQQPHKHQPGFPELLPSQTWHSPTTSPTSLLIASYTPRISSCYNHTFSFPWSEPSWSLFKNNFKQRLYVPFMYESCISRI